jgi:hypothetical protein
MSKQTAVEWLEHEIRVRYHSGALDLITISELKMHAKVMEKEQIIKAFCEGYDHDGDNYDGAEISYYNRTYKGGEQ